MDQTDENEIRSDYWYQYQYWYQYKLILNIYIYIIYYLNYLY